MKPFMSLASDLSSTDKDIETGRPRVLSFEPNDTPKDSYEFHFSNCTVHLEIADRGDKRKAN